MATQYDLLIIGSGTAAMVAAMRVRTAGWRVGIIDYRPYGGTCALRGWTRRRCSSARPRPSTMFGG